MCNRCSIWNPGNRGCRSFETRACNGCDQSSWTLGRAISARRSASPTDRLIWYRARACMCDKFTRRNWLILQMSASAPAAGYAAVLRGTYTAVGLLDRTSEIFVGMHGRGRTRIRTSALQNAPRCCVAPPYAQTNTNSGSFVELWSALWLCLALSSLWGEGIQGRF